MRNVFLQQQARRNLAGGRRRNVHPERGTPRVAYRIHRAVSANGQTVHVAVAYLIRDAGRRIAILVDLAGSSTVRPEIGPPAHLEWSRPVPGTEFLPAELMAEAGPSDWRALVEATQAFIDARVAAMVYPATPFGGGDGDGGGVTALPAPADVAA